MNITSSSTVISALGLTFLLTGCAATNPNNASMRSGASLYDLIAQGQTLSRNLRAEIAVGNCVDGTQTLQFVFSNVRAQKEAISSIHMRQDPAQSFRAIGAFVQGVKQPIDAMERYFQVCGRDVGLQETGPSDAALSYLRPSDEQLRFMDAVFATGTCDQKADALANFAATMGENVQRYDHAVGTSDINLFDALEGLRAFSTGIYYTGRLAESCYNP